MFYILKGSAVDELLFSLDIGAIIDYDPVIILIFVVSPLVLVDVHLLFDCFWLFLAHYFEI